MTIKNPKQTGKMYIKVPCGKCEACVRNRASQWFVRLLMQQRYSGNSVFVTLTYDDQHLPYRVTDDGVLLADVCREDIRHYHARLRKSLGVKSQKLKYFLISEYGPNPSNGWLHRPHYHAIYFNLDTEDYPKVERAWRCGFIQFGELCEERIRYVSGYVTEKLFLPPDVERTFSFISNGIGLDYVENYREFHKNRIDRFFVPVDGRKEVMPRYYKERLYSDAQRAIFELDCAARAERKFDNDLRACGGDVDKLAERYHDQRANYVRKLRKQHKNKKNG